MSSTPRASRGQPRFRAGDCLAGVVLGGDAIIPGLGVDLDGALFIGLRPPWRTSSAFVRRARESRRQDDGVLAY
jgi:hypothetical protein